MMQIHNIQPIPSHGTTQIVSSHDMHVHAMSCIYKAHEYILCVYMHVYACDVCIYMWRVYTCDLCSTFSLRDLQSSLFSRSWEDFMVEHLVSSGSTQNSSHTLAFLKVILCVVFCWGWPVPYRHSVMHPFQGDTQIGHPCFWLADCPVSPATVSTAWVWERERRWRETMSGWGEREGRYIGVLSWLRWNTQYYI